MSNFCSKRGPEFKGKNLQNFATISQVANFRNHTIARVWQINLARYYSSATIAILSFMLKFYIYIYIKKFLLFINIFKKRIFFYIYIYISKNIFS